MSIIACDGKIIAADRQSTCVGLRTRTRKLFRLSADTIVAIAGNETQGLVLIEWYKAGADPKAWPAFQAEKDYSLFAVVHKGKCTKYDQQPIGTPILEKRWAMGAGRDYAIAAMEMGADAIRAVKITSKFDNTCGLGVDHFDLRF